MRATMSLTAAEQVVDAACVLVGSTDPRDLVALLMLAQAEVLVRCHQPGDLDRAIEQTAALGGRALADLIGKVRDQHLAEAKPEGSA